VCTNCFVLLQVLHRSEWFMRMLSLAAVRMTYFGRYRMHVQHKQLDSELQLLRQLDQLCNSHGRVDMCMVVDMLPMARWLVPLAR
jgi:hypothetical protein